MDRQTDGQTTCNRKTAFCTIVHRAVKKLGYATRGVPYVSCSRIFQSRTFQSRIFSAPLWTTGHPIIQTYTIRARLHQQHDETTRGHPEMVACDLELWPQKILLCISGQGQDLYSHQKLNIYIYWFSSESSYRCRRRRQRRTPQYNQGDILLASWKLWMDLYDIAGVWRIIFVDAVSCHTGKKWMAKVAFTSLQGKT